MNIFFRIRTRTAQNDEWAIPKRQKVPRSSTTLSALAKGLDVVLGSTLPQPGVGRAVSADGGLVRRFRFELFDPDISDVKLKHDFFVPTPKLDTKDVTVKVIEVVS
ncbi:hypothetical protein CLCR_07763 [Cladophialophora carrionii]|uniref:Uncharacterized protein n=1 Tax=Cladophialophora carrionii TaxID=86049 RepID=A0A1C1CP25_9EURO|nr:hypothetical protein CLCR_07763 [Cladophialophora carrionii]